MTFFEPIPSLHDRAMSLEHSRAALEALATAHERYHRSLCADTLWRRFRNSDGMKGTTLSALRNAGLIEDTSRSSSSAQMFRLTLAGYAAIGREPPFWQEVA